MPDPSPIAAKLRGAYIPSDKKGRRSSSRRSTRRGGRK